MNNSWNDDRIATSIETSRLIARLRENDRVIGMIRRMVASGEVIKRVCFTPAVKVPSLKIPSIRI
jgi:hypothetical protein